MSGASSSSKRDMTNELQYGIDDTPSWPLTILLGFQHYLTMFGGVIAVPLILSGHLCMDEDPVAVSEVISTVFFVAGITTILQSTLGVRLPIIQGGTFTFVSPVISIMALPQWQCPVKGVANGNMSDIVMTTEVGMNGFSENTTIDGREVWQMRMREVQGAITLASLLEVLVGLSGLLGIMLRYIGPLTIAPTITLIGLSLLGAATAFCEKHWGIAILTMALVCIFSQYLRNINLPWCRYSRSTGCQRRAAPFFKLFPVILAILISWAVCAAFTEAGVFPDDPGYGARTDTKIDVLFEAKWFRFPYPFQWGIPTVSAASVLGMLAGVVAGIMESIGDYYACARLSGAPPPPVYAVNRDVSVLFIGITVEGIGCVLAGLWGSGTATTSYSENIGAIGITKVASRRVVQAAAVLMIILGMFGKFGALFVTIPDPVVGGIFMVMFAMVSAVGVSNLQYVDLNSSRNLFIFGFSVFIGLAIPNWISQNPNLIQTGVVTLDQIIMVILTTSMFVGGALGFILDNTIPGWKKMDKETQTPDDANLQVIELTSSPETNAAVDSDEIVVVNL